MSSLTEKLNKLKESVKPRTEKSVKIELLKKPAKSKQTGKGGKRDGAGRKPQDETLIKKGIKQWIDDHVKEDVKITVLDKSTGKTVEIKKTRLMYALEMLYQIGTGATSKGNAGALSMWLDRALGKPPQTLRGGDEDDAPLRVDIGFDVMLDKVYPDDK
jgi:hypothetical protein